MEEQNRKRDYDWSLSLIDSRINIFDNEKNDTTVSQKNGLTIESYDKSGESKHFDGKWNIDLKLILCMYVLLPWHSVNPQKNNGNW